MEKKGRCSPMAVNFPLYINLKGDNCTIFGGGLDAYEAAVTLRRFGAKITVVSPLICEQLKEMDEKGEIRYLRRKYFRGDCSSARLCMAFTEDPSLNISISDECKNKNIPVAVSKPEGFGNFSLPIAVVSNDIVISVSGGTSQGLRKHIIEQIEKNLPAFIDAYQKA